ncbi:unnamed protein product [Periconia digitata]|uniref:Uncharacterized protein n=1 Tax=Periconia digitata TaxID=1303443 RepID=A0A9W4UIR2_9PLEO|nr:unnamed protein product [Periconia digitata]
MDSDVRSECVLLWAVVLQPSMKNCGPQWRSHGEFTAVSWGLCITRTRISPFTHPSVHCHPTPPCAFLESAHLP